MDIIPKGRITVTVPLRGTSTVVEVVGGVLELSSEEHTADAAARHQETLNQPALQGLVYSPTPVVGSPAPPKKKDPWYYLFSRPNSDSNPDESGDSSATITTGDFDNKKPNDPLSDKTKGANTTGALTYTIDLPSRKTANSHDTSLMNNVDDGMYPLPGSPDCIHPGGSWVPVENDATDINFKHMGGALDELEISNDD